MDVQNAFYVYAMVYMSIMLIITIAALVALFVIKKKIDAIHRRIEEKVNMVTNIAHLGSDLVGAAKKAVGKL